MKGTPRVWAVLLIASMGAGWLTVIPCSAHGDDSPLASSRFDPSERPPRLTDAAGKVRQTVSTDEERAAAFYNQGLAWFHSYGFIEATRAFHQALRYDPKLAVAELGLARS